MWWFLFALFYLLVGTALVGIMLRAGVQQDDPGFRSWLGSKPTLVDLASLVVLITLWPATVSVIVLFAMERRDSS